MNGTERGAAAREIVWPDPIVVADLMALRHSAPLVHCITNMVAASFTANALLALGAAPAMVVAEEEIDAFAPIASGLLINLGTILTQQVPLILAAARRARGLGKPWVLDPVGVGALPLRSRVAAALLDFHPTIIRGNASEIVALTGGAGGGRGVESTLDSATAVAAAQALARQTGAVVAVSGAVDYVTEGKAVTAVPGGHRLMTKVTGIGCALGGAMAAFAAVSASPLQAAISSSAVFGAAGARAAAVAAHPGSFAVAFLDRLAALGASEADGGRATR